MTIGPALRHYAGTFIQRRGLSAVDVGDPTCTSFVWNESLVVNLTDDEAAERISALTQVGRIPIAIASPDSSVEANRWIEHHHRNDRFEWMSACDMRSGSVVLVSGISTTGLDDSSFAEWLGHYLDRVDIAASVFRGR